MDLLESYTLKDLHDKGMVKNVAYLILKINIKADNDIPMIQLFALMLLAKDGIGTN